MTSLPSAASAAITFCYPHGDDLLVVDCAVSGVCPRLPARHEGEVVRSGAAGEFSSSLLQQLPVLTLVSCVGKTHTKAGKQSVTCSFFLSFSFLTLQLKKANKHEKS